MKSIMKNNINRPLMEKYRYALVILLLVLVFLFAACQETAWYKKVLDYEKLAKYDESTQTIAFIDTGISKELEEDFNIIDKYNALDDTNDVDDDNGHGTRVMSVACATGSHDVSGLSPNASVIVIKAADKDGRMNFQSLYNALSFARNKKVSVVNISLGGYKKSKNVEKLIRKMYQEGITVVAASGDYSQKDILFPASLSPYVISVAALETRTTLWENSNIDKTLVCTFPGVDIETLDLEGNVALETGTSEATALASAYVAKLKGEYFANNGKSMKNDKVINSMKRLNILEHHNINFLEVLQ